MTLQSLDVLGVFLFCLEIGITAIYMAYALRVYVFTAVLKRKSKTVPEDDCPDLRQPFVSIMIPTFNEPNVVDRILKACTSLDYDNYEVIVVDDSTDETIEKLRRWDRHPRVKVVHREVREGWKGGALNHGLKFLDPRSEFVLVFDADFVPPRDIIQRMLRRFTGDDVAAVQGNQWHILNADENWITKCVRTLTAITYFFDMVARQRIGGFTQLCGSVMMIRRKMLEEVGGFGTSITEDWELTLKLYKHGYRVVYDETIKVPCECPSTFRRFIRQQARWAEGHTRNFRRYFWSIIRNKKLSLVRKLDFIFVGCVFLLSLLFIIGQSAVLLEVVLGVFHQSPLPFSLRVLMTVVMGFAYPLSLRMGLLNDKAPRGKYSIIIALIMSYLLTPFIAYASLRGLLLSRGSFHRTFKTGRITREDLLPISLRSS